MSQRGDDLSPEVNKVITYCNDKDRDLFLDTICYESFVRNKFNDLFCRDKLKQLSLNIKLIQGLKPVNYLIKKKDDYKKYEGTLISCGFAHEYISPFEKEIIEREVYNVWRYLRNK